MRRSVVCNSKASDRSTEQPNDLATERPIDRRVRSSERQSDRQAGSDGWTTSRGGTHTLPEQTRSDQTRHGDVVSTSTRPRYYCSCRRAVALFVPLCLPCLDCRYILQFLLHFCCSFFVCCDCEYCKIIALLLDCLVASRRAASAALD